MLTQVRVKADRLLEMGFTEEVQELVKMCPVKRQTMLFSATMTHDVKQVSSRGRRRRRLLPFLFLLLLLLLLLLALATLRATLRVTALGSWRRTRSTAQFA